MDNYQKPYRPDTSGRYRILITGLLDKRWSGHLCDMAISSRRRPGGSAITVLSGELVDQAALMGVLNAVYDLGHTLLKVERLAEKRPPAQS